MRNLRSFFEQSQARADQVSGSQDQAKKAAALAALELVESGMTLGLGTGSTVEFFLQGLAERIQAGLDVRGVPTSSKTEVRARELGIPLVDDGKYPSVENQLCVDGADRVDEAGNLIKGGGGALLREKLVATHSSRVCILVDPTKLVAVFDHTFPLPVECLDFGVNDTVQKIGESGCSVSLRKGRSDEPIRTDNNNVIADCVFQQIVDPVAVELRMLSLPGVMEVGIFSQLLDHLIVGFADGTALQWSADQSHCHA